MELSSSLLKSFAEINNDTSEVSGAGTAYGTIYESEGKRYVMLDGATSLTAVVEATDCRAGDRVIVTIENHTATITNNLSNPSSGYTATETDDTVSAYYGEFQVLSAYYADITYLEAYSTITEYLEAEYANINLLNVNTESVKELFVDVGVLTDATITNGYITGQLNGVTMSASDLTAGTIDAGEIDVINLNCANLTVGQINGYQIADGAITSKLLGEEVASLIDTAYSTAIGKNTVYYDTSAPSGGTYTVNDIWFDTDNDYLMYYWNGSSWTAAELGTAAILDGAIATSKIATGAVTASEIASQTITAANIASYTITGTQIAADTISADKLYIGTGGNLYSNYDTFEQITDSCLYYSKSGTVTSATITTATSWYGSKCLALTGNGDTYVYLGNSINNYGCIPVTAGKYYRISCYTKATGSYTPRLFVVGHTAVNTTNSAHTEFNTSASTSWTRLEGTYQATSTYPYISIRVGFNSSSSITAYFDAIQVEMVSDTSQIAGDFKPSGTTTINGGNIITRTITASHIAAGTITANEIDVTNLFAQDITASGTISGITIEAANVYAVSGEFKGSVYATSFKLDDVSMWISTYDGYKVLALESGYSFYTDTMILAPYGAKLGGVTMMGNEVSCSSGSITTMHTTSVYVEGNSAGSVTITSDLEGGNIAFYHASTARHYEFDTYGGYLRLWFGTDGGSTVQWACYFADTGQINSIPMIGSDGVMEINRYLDFHEDTAAAYDYDTRLYVTTDAERGQHFYIDAPRIRIPCIRETTVTNAANVRCTENGMLYTYSSSSERYKNIIRELTEDDILPLYDIPTYYFQYIEGYVGTDDERYGQNIPGFIAERWNEVMPIAVDHLNDGLPEMWNSNIVVPLTFEMVKHNHTEIEELKAQIALLEAKLEALQGAA